MGLNKAAKRPPAPGSPLPIPFYVKTPPHPPAAKNCTVHGPGSHVLEGLGLRQTRAAVVPNGEIPISCCVGFGISDLPLHPPAGLSWPGAFYFCFPEAGGAPPILMGLKGEANKVVEAGPSPGLEGNLWQVLYSRPWAQCMMGTMSGGMF